MSVGAFRDDVRTPALLQLTTGGRLASRTPVGTELAPLFSDGFALTPLGRDDAFAVHFRLARIGSSRSVTLTLPRTDVYEIQAFGRDGAGRTILAGGLGQAGGILVRFLPSGALDLAYGDNGKIAVSGSELIVKRDGRVFVSDGDDIVGFDAKGRTLKGFARRRVPTPRGIKGYAKAFAEGPGGTFLVAGAGETRGWVARLRPNGRLDRRFGHQGFLFRPKPFRYSDVEAITRDRRGRVVLAGTTSTTHTYDDYAAFVFRLTARGRMDLSFGRRGAKVFRLGVAPGLGISASGADSVAIDDRGRIFVAGEVFDDDFVFREDTGNPYPAIARLLG